MNKVIIGLTGGIGSGKTTVSDMFAKKGIDVVDADLVAREVVKPKTPGLTKLVEAFSESILFENGELDRTKLRELVFSNEQRKNQLNSILHPLIRQEMLNQIDNTQSQYCILSAPLLFENNLQKMVNLTVAVDISEQEQIERTSKRDKSSIDIIKSIISAQVSRYKRISLADEIIDNSRDLVSLQEQVDKLHLKFLKLAISTNK